MFLFNITINIDFSLEKQSLNDLKTKLIPAIKAKKITKNIRLLNLLTEIDNGGATYSLQLEFDNSDDFMSYEMNFFDGDIAEFSKPYSGKMVYFTTLLEEIAC